VKRWGEHGFRSGPGRKGNVAEVIWAIWRRAPGQWGKNACGTAQTGLLRRGRRGRRDCSRADGAGAVFPFQIVGRVTGAGKTNDPAPARAGAG